MYPQFYEMMGFQHPGGVCFEGCPPAPNLSTTALLIDFDGTLIDMAETPDQTFVPKEVPETMSRLAEAAGGAVAVITGRSVDEVRRLLPGYTGAIVGGHGAEVLVGTDHWVHPLAGSETVAKMTQIAHALTALDPRLIVEPKPAGVAVHCLRVPEMHSRICKFMDAIRQQFPEFDVCCGRRAVELRPRDVNRADAVIRLLDRTPFKGRRPVYFGDDQLDERAMEYVVGTGGFAIKVGDAESYASHRLRGSKEVRDCLEVWSTPRRSAA
ncbi:trehalose-phosphatase [Tranquillimonas alkanivorans]|uniref:Trehalose 6-phosphate phosphatase n=1 Tax=Tranquillimonas alkanivorans TaxID=441119 RepID=A0A1I5S236_9RHOB|nr:trehalose-phosphatase [Tranquillimonas alkanivorans]SFP64832.1 trehalose 6-phosphatase [Tranquillimonas alkanivorans]